MAIRRGFGLVITLILVAVTVSVGAMGALYFILSREPTVVSGSTLVLRIHDDLREAEPTGVLAQFLPTPTVRSVVEALRKAKADRRINGILLVPTAQQSLWAKVQEIRDAIVDFKQSGKPIVAFLEYGTDQTYYLATACDKVFLAPGSPLDLDGLASYSLFLRGMLDKIGAFPDFMHIGDYKAAAEMFTEKTFSAAARENAESMNRDIFDQLIQGIATGRKKTEAEVTQLIDQGPFLPEDAVRLGLVDDLAYEDQIDDKAGKQFASGDKRVENKEYDNVSLSSLGMNRGQKVAVVYAVGMIASGDSGQDGPQGDVLGSDTLVKSLRRARDDDAIKAIVMRVDSPGGSAIASDIIWRDVLLARNKKPLVVSMGDVAASGGYYISMPAHAIVAQPSTLTGSIGVVSGKFVVQGTLDKLGVNLEGLSYGRNAQMTSPIRPFSPEERAKMEEQMQAIYDQFVEKAAQGRGTTPEKIDMVAQGRVWTGRQAKNNGLVDELGGLGRAVAIAKQRAKIPANEDVELVIYPPRKSFYELLREPLGSQTELLAAWMDPAERRALGALSSPLRLFRQGEPLALMPNVFFR